MTELVAGGATPVRLAEPNAGLTGPAVWMAGSPSVWLAEPNVWLARPNLTGPITPIKPTTLVKR